MKLIVLLLALILIAGGWWYFYGRGGDLPLSGYWPTGEDTSSGEVDEDAANDARRKTDLAMIKAALVVYEVDYDTYPEELSQLVERGYLSSIPKDPETGNDYGYEKTASGCTLTAILSDGTPYVVASD